MSANYLDAIRAFEGFTPKASWDYAQFTNGYGTKAKFAGEVIDKAEADRRFQAEIAEARQIVEKHAPHVDDGTKAALTSLTFNAGDKWARSGLGEAIRSGDTERARELFLQYNKAGGEVLPGLAKRRVAEAAWIGNPQIAAGSERAAPPHPELPTAGAAIASVSAQHPSIDRFVVRDAERARAEMASAEPAVPPDTPASDTQSLTAEEIEAELLSKIRGAVSGYGGEARMTQLLFASKLIGAPSSQDDKSEAPKAKV